MNRNVVPRQRTEPEDVQAMYDNIPVADKKLQWVEGTKAHRAAIWSSSAALNQCWSGLRAIWCKTVAKRGPEPALSPTVKQRTTRHDRGSRKWSPDISSMRIK